MEATLASAPLTTRLDRVLARTILPLIPRWVKPNHLTVIRLALTPWVVWALAREISWRNLALFLITAFTDALDGTLARVRHQVTEWGKLYDPLADKLLIGSVLVVLVTKMLPPLIAAAVIGLEAIIVTAAVREKRRGRSIQANAWGKGKMLFEVGGVTLLLLSVLLATPLLYQAALAAFVLALITGAVSLATYSV